MTAPTTSPAPSAAEVKERLRATLDAMGNHAAGLIFKDTLTAALSLIERGELERERLKLWQDDADRLASTFKAHEVETLDCDRSGRTHCDCLERAIRLHEEIKKTCAETESLAARLAARAPKEGTP